MCQSSSCHVQQAQDGVGAPEKIETKWRTPTWEENIQKSNIYVSNPPRNCRPARKIRLLRRQCALHGCKGFLPRTGVMSGTSAKCTLHTIFCEWYQAALGQPQWRNALNISKITIVRGAGGGSEAKSPAFCNGRHMAKKAQIQSARPLRMIVEWASIYIRYDVNIKSVTCSATCRAGERRPYKSFSARAIILRWILNAQFCLLTFKIWIQMPLPLNISIAIYPGKCVPNAGCAKTQESSCLKSSIRQLLMWTSGLLFSVEKTADYSLSSCMQRTQGWNSFRARRRQCGIVQL